MTEIEFNSESDHLVIILLFAVTATIGSLAVYSLIYAQTGIGAATLLVDLVFSSFLIYLYLRMARTQERQQEIMKAHHKPILEKGPVDLDGGTLHFSLGNSGNGPIKDLNLVTDLKTSTDYQGSIGSTELVKNVDQGPENANIPPLKMGNSLDSSEGPKHFTATPVTAVISPGGDVKRGYFRDCLDKVLEDNERVDIEYEIYVEGEDVFGDEIQEPILYGQIDGIESPLRFVEIHGLGGAQATA